MAGSKHVAEKQLAFGAGVVVKPLLCCIDVAGSEIPVTQDGVFYETDPFYRVAPLSRISGHPGMV